MLRIYITFFFFFFSQFEEAAKDVADEVTNPRPEGEETVKDIQILLTSDDNPANLRDLKSDVVSRLVKVPGIIVSASGIRSKATSMTIQCRGCQNVVSNISIKLGLDGLAMPRKCNTYVFSFFLKILIQI